MSPKPVPIPDPTSDGAPPAWLVWDGVRWYRTARGYYQDRHGTLLHRAVYARCNGLELPLPEDVEIHHLDHDTANNAIANLDARDRSVHRAYHALARDDRAWLDQQSLRAIGDTARAMWEVRSPVAVVCLVCGQQFDSRGMRAFYCSSRCSDRAHRERRRNGDDTPRERCIVKSCENCGARFTAALERARFCSQACKKRFRRRSRSPLPARVCAYAPCGAEFSPKRSDAVYCSPACGAAARRLDRRVARYLAGSGA